MAAGLSKLATALTVIFIISLATLVAELFYVLWRRRVFHRRTQSLPITFAGVDTNSQTSSDTYSSAFTSFSSTSSKELLYFFCLNRNKEISQVQPRSSPPELHSTGSALDDEMEVIDVFKLPNMYGPSRALFTIKEEDKEADFESTCSFSEKMRTEKHSKRISLEDCLKLVDQPTVPEIKVDVVGGEDQDGISINMDNENETTPFSTPCESPLYFTPTASPTREEKRRDISGKRVKWSDEIVVGGTRLGC